MTKETGLTGGCLCGAIRYATSTRPFAAEYCHCSICRKSSGGPVVAWMDFERDQVTWAGDAPTEYHSSETVWRGFCPQCGASLTFRDSRYPDYLTLTIASLDEPNLVTPTYHIYAESQVAWFNIADDHPRYARGPEKS